jgi:hypothetical protein
VSLRHRHLKAGLPDGIFSNQNPNLGKFWRVLQWKLLVYLCPFGILYSHFPYFMVIWYFFWLIGIFCPALKNLATLLESTMPASDITPLFTDNNEHIKTRKYILLSPLYSKKALSNAMYLKTN